MNVRYLWRIAAAMAACVVTPASRSAADVIVEAWDFGCGIVPPNSDANGVFFNVVQTPFHASHGITWYGATDNSNYDVTFDSQTFDFQMAASVTAPGVATNQSFRSICDGGMRLSNGPTPLLVSADSTFNWALPAGDREAHVDLGVRRVGAEYFYSGSGGATPRVGEPAAGMVSLHRDSIFLPANGVFSFTYGLEVDSFGGSPSELGRGDGTVQFHAQVVPEPSPLVLLIVAAYGVHRWFHFRR